MIKEYNNENMLQQSRTATVVALHSHVNVDSGGSGIHTTIQCIIIANEVVYVCDLCTTHIRCRVALKFSVGTVEK